MSVDETIRKTLAPVAAPGREYDANLLRLGGLAVAIFLAMTYLAGENFLSYANLKAILSGCSELGILSLGIMLAMITGGIDLSAVGIANLSSICAALLLHSALNAPPERQVVAVGLAIVLSLVIATVCGALNGFFIGVAGINPILATLGTMQLFTGVATVVTSGYAVHSYPEMFTRLGNDSLGILPYSFIIFFLVMLGVAVYAKWRPTGRKIYFVGANPKAARFSGISNLKTLFATYATAGFLAGVAGLVSISRTNSAKADYGASYTMQAILVCLLAGVDPSGGKGRVAGLFIAVLALQFLSAGFNQMRTSNFARDFTWGVFLVFVILFNYAMNRWDDHRRIRRLARNETAEASPAHQ